MRKPGFWRFSEAAGSLCQCVSSSILLAPHQRGWGFVCWFLLYDGEAESEQDTVAVFQNSYSSYLYDRESPKKEVLSLPGQLLV